MKNSDLMERVELANPVRQGAFQDLTETSESRDLVERIVASQQRPNDVGDSSTERRARGIVWMRRPRSFVAGAVALALVLGVVAVVSWPKPDSDSSTAWAASLVKLAQGSPRLLVAADGWEVVRADEVSTEQGDMSFSDGQNRLELIWMSAADHDTHIKYLERGAQASWTMKIAGEKAALFQHDGTTDFSASWLDGGHTVLLHGRFPNVDNYRAVASRLERVDVNTWLSALPESVVQPYERSSSVESMLVDIPVHPSVDVEELKDSPEVRDRYQLGAEVTAAVSCAWIGQWVDATNEGDEASAREAVDAMATARDWTILHDMNQEGDWPEVVWEYADAMADNSSVPAGRPMTVEEGYRSALGCEGG